MNENLQILILSDGKAGHESQSLGLAEAMSRIGKAEIHILRLNLEMSFLGRLRELVKKSTLLPRPVYVIGAGTATNFPLIWIAKRYGAKSICLMKPGLPLSLYDFCITPEHDFPTPPKAKNVILSKGALNRVVAAGGNKSGRLLLIGGPSRIHGYDEDGLIAEVSKIASGGGWQVANSRRTPETFLKKLLTQVPDLTVFRHEETADGWLAKKLSEVEEVWVTEDSVSMIYESLTGGARVGILKMPRLRPSSRVLRGLGTLMSEGYLISSETAAPPLLREAERCAALVLDSVEKPR